MDGKAVGERIKRRRKALRLTQKALAAKAGLFSQSISRYELGRVPDTEELIRLAQALDAKPSELLTGELPPEPQGGTSDEQAHYREDAAALIAKDLRQHPADIEWVKGLLSILRHGGKGRRLGIQENLKAFLGDMDRERSAPEPVRRARDAG